MLFGDLGRRQVKQCLHGSYPIDWYILHLLVMVLGVFTFASTCFILLWMDFHPCIYTYNIFSVKALTSLNINVIGVII